jgi:hypothetical protein
VNNHNRDTVKPKGQSISLDWPWGLTSGTGWTRKESLGSRFGCRRELRREKVVGILAQVGKRKELEL